jgi:hypothetical protein
MTSPIDSAKTDAGTPAWHQIMSFGRHEREALAVLLFVVVFATASCDGHDAPPRRSSPDRDAGTSPAAVGPTETPTAEAASPVAGPTRATVIRRLDGRRIRLHGTKVVLDRDTVACGRASTSDAGPQQTRIRFRCVQPTFPPGRLVGPDAIFFVHVNHGGRLVISDARFTSY